MLTYDLIKQISLVNCMTMMEMKMSFEGQNIWRYVDRFAETFYIFSRRIHSPAPMHG